MFCPWTGLWRSEDRSHGPVSSWAWFPGFEDPLQSRESCCMYSQIGRTCSCVHTGESTIWKTCYERPYFSNVLLEPKFFGSKNDDLHFLRSPLGTSLPTSRLVVGGTREGQYYLRFQMKLAASKGSKVIPTLSVLQSSVYVVFPLGSLCSRPPDLLSSAADRAELLWPALSQQVCAGCHPQGPVHCPAGKQISRSGLSKQPFWV